MQQEKKSTPQPIHPISLGKRMLTGAAIALTTITVFLTQVGEPDPEWGKFWMMRPLVIVPLAGAMGGVCSYIMDHMHYRCGWNKTFTNILSLLVYIIGLWMGIVLGLDGTLWN